MSRTTAKFFSGLLALLLAIAPVGAWAAGTPVQTTAGSVTALSTGANSVGYVGSFSFQVAPTVTVQNAAYSAGNSMGGLITVTGAARTNGGSFTPAAIRLKSTGGATNTVWIYAWTKSPAATCTDKAAFVASASDNAFAVPGFPVQATFGGAPGAWDTATYAQILGLNTPAKNQDTSPGTALYECIVTAGAVTPATTGDITQVVAGWQD